MSNKKVTIYGLIDPRDGSMFYVGSSVNPHLRHYRHRMRHYAPTRLRSILIELERLGCGFEMQSLAVVDAGHRDAEEYSWIIRCVDSGEPLVNQMVPIFQRQIQGYRLWGKGFKNDRRPTT